MHVSFNDAKELGARTLFGLSTRTAIFDSLGTRPQQRWRRIVVGWTNGAVYSGTLLISHVSKAHGE
jgi:hypothetical protein